jgi:hypothetical protein
MAHLLQFVGRFRILGAAVLCLVMTARLAAAVTQPIITDVSIAQSTWMAMAVDVTYDHPGPADTLQLAVRWRRLNGERLDFLPVTARIEPGHGQLRLETRYRGMLPPPSRIVLHLEVTTRGGQRVLTRDCALTLVNARGKPAWAADLMRRQSGALAWVVKSCR